MSIWRSFVLIRGFWSFIRRKVCLLSHLISISSSGSNCSCLNNLFHAYTFFDACVSASSSASVVDVVTVSCLRDVQSTAPPYSLKTAPSVLRRESTSSAKAASLVASNILIEVWVFFVYEYWIDNVLVSRRYVINLSAALMCAVEGFIA